METQTELFPSAPDVSPEDVWGDAPCLATDGQAPAVLPPKRVKPDTADGDGGLRIGTRTSSHSAAETFAKLEVQEFHGDVVRLEPEETDAARMPRHVVFHEKPTNHDALALAGEARDWGSSKRQPIFWILGTGVVVTSVVVGAILALPLINKPTRSNESEWLVEPVANGEAMADMLSHKGEAWRAFREFLTAPSIEAMLPLTRNSAEVSDLIKAKRRMPKLPPDAPPLKIDSWTACENQSLTYAILTITLPDYSKFEAYFTVIDGRLVMDWKASTGYGTADFAELLMNQGNPAEIRGWIEESEFYTGAFSENSHQAYQLASPDRQQVIWAYARRGSGIHQSLRTLIKGGYILEGGKEAQKVTVRLDPGPGGSLPGQWAIVELLHKEWIAP